MMIGAAVVPLHRRDSRIVTVDDRRFDEWVAVVNGWTSRRATAEIVELAGERELKR